MQYRFLFFLCVLCMPPLLPHPIWAQESDTLHYMLDEAVHVMRRLSHSQTSSVPVRESNREEILRLGMGGLSDVLKQMQGVDVHDYGGVGGLKTVSVRGMGAKHTAVSYGGVLVSDAQSGMVDLGRIPLDNIEGVSLALGQSDAAFPRAARDFALSSILVLKTLDKNEHSYVKLQGGSFGFVDVSAFGSFAGVGAVENMTLYADYVRSDGMYPFSLVNGSETSWKKRCGGDSQSFVLEGNAAARLWGGSLSAKSHYYNSERGLPGSVHMYNKGNSERLWNRNFFTQAVYDCAVGDFDVRAALKYDYNYSRYIEKNNNYASGEQIDKNFQNEMYASFAIADQRRWRGVALSMATDVSYATLRNNFANSREPNRVSSYTVLAGSYSWPTGELLASLLATYIKDYVDAGAPASYSRLSPSLSVSVMPFAALPLRLRVSFKDSYRIPTFADLYYLRLGNVGLIPEKAMQCNIGITWGDTWNYVFSRASLALDCYYNKVRDKIVALPTMYIWRMMNFGRADILGVDVCADVECRFSSNVSLISKVGYSFQYAVDVTERDAKNYRHQLPYTPRHSGNMSLSLLNPLVNVSYILTAVGERYMLPQNIAENRMSGYVEHSFSLNREFQLSHSAKMRLQCEFLNVTDVSYEVIRYYPMPGFQWRTSVRVMF